MKFTVTIPFTFFRGGKPVNELKKGDHLDISQEEAFGIRDNINYSDVVKDSPNKMAKEGKSK